MTVPAARLLAAPPPAWRELLEGDRSATPAHDPRVWRALEATRPGHAAAFLAVEESGALVGGAGLVVERRAGTRWLHALPWVLPGAPLARAGRHAEVDLAVGHALAALQREWRVAGGGWALYRAGAPPVDAAAFELPSGETRWLESGVVELTEGLEAAWRRVDRKTRQEIERARGSGLELGESGFALDPAYALHLAQARHWGGHRPLPLALARRLLSGGDAPARLFTVRRGGELLAAVYALTGSHEVMPWWSGARPEARRRHAYALLLWHVVEWAHAHGAARVNLGASAGLGGVASFKDALGATRLRWPVRWLDARHAGLVGRLASAAQRFARRGRPRGEEA